MRGGKDPQCIRVDGDDFKPVASGWGGALAMSDGKTRICSTTPTILVAFILITTSCTSTRSSGIKVTGSLGRGAILCLLRLTS